jgi:hypothetical protein
MSHTHKKGVPTLEIDSQRRSIRTAFDCGAEAKTAWSAIGAVECIGPDHFTMVRVEIVGLDGVLRNVSPDTPRALERARAAFGQGYTLLEPWTAGLEGQALARAITEGKSGVGERVN